MLVLLGVIAVLGAASEAGAEIGNTEKHEGSWILFLLIGSLLWWVVWGIIRMFATPINWPNGRTSNKAGITLGYLWMCLFPLLFYLGMDRAHPPMLGTKVGFVRIMSTGELLQSGTLLRTTRFERSSKVVPLSDRTTTLWFNSLEQDGFSTRVTATVEYRLRSGEPLRQLLVRRYADIPFLSAGYGSAARMQYPFLDEEVAKILHPVIDETFNELSTHPINGAPSELTIRSRGAAEHTLPSLPLWLEYVRVSNVSVESWKKDQ